MKKSVSFLGMDISKEGLKELVQKTLAIEPIEEIIEVVSLQILGKRLKELPNREIHIIIHGNREYAGGRCYSEFNPIVIESTNNHITLAHEIGHAFGLRHAKYHECSYCNVSNPACGDKLNIMCYNAAIPFHNPWLAHRFSEKDLKKLRGKK